MSGRRDLLVGYARVSPLHRDTAAQVAWLRERGVAAENIWTDRGFAGRPVRPVGRDGAIQEARRASLLVPAWGRLARSAGDLAHVLEQLAANRTRLLVDQDSHTPASCGRLAAQVRVVATLQAELVQLRHAERAAAPKPFHPKPSASNLQRKKFDRTVFEEDLMAELYQGGLGIAELGDIFSASRASVYRIVTPAAGETSTRDSDRIL